jgi:hypothetical protein
VAVRDSSGVRVVENSGPGWVDQAEAWTVEPHPEIVIRGDFGEPDHYLFQPWHVVRLSDGPIIVGNQGTQELFIFDSLGTFVRAAGGAGEGPGELQALFGLFRCDSDTLMALERSRISVWDKNGDFVRTIPLFTGGLPPSREVHAVSTDCTAGLFVENVNPRPQLVPGVNDIRATVLWAAFGNRSRDTIAAVVRDQTYIWQEGSELRDIWLPYAERSAWSANGDEVIVGQGDFELAVFGRFGQLRELIRWEAARSPLTGQDRDELARSLSELFDRIPEEAQYWPPVSDIPLPDPKPAYVRVIASEKAVWVQQAGSWDRSNRWWVFTPSGSWLGSVETPAELRVLTIDDEFVIGVFHDENDVENIRLHRLRRPNP